MNTKRFLPNYKTANMVDFHTYTSESNAWTAPVNCFASFYPNSGGGAGDLQLTFYIKDKSGSSYNTLSRSANGTFSWYQGTQVFLKSGDSVYFICNQPSITYDIRLVYYPLIAVD